MASASAVLTQDMYDLFTEQYGVTLATLLENPKHTVTVVDMIELVGDTRMHLSTRSTTFVLDRVTGIVAIETDGFIRDDGRTADSGRHAAFFPEIVDSTSVTQARERLAEVASTAQFLARPRGSFERSFEEERADLLERVGGEAYTHPLYCATLVRYPTAQAEAEVRKQLMRETRARLNKAARDLIAKQ